MQQVVWKKYPVTQCYSSCVIGDCSIYGLGNSGSDIARSFLFQNHVSVAFGLYLGALLRTAQEIGDPEIQYHIDPKGGKDIRIFHQSI